MIQRPFCKEICRVHFSSRLHLVITAIIQRVVLILMIICRRTDMTVELNFFFFIFTAINNLKKFFTAFGLIILSWISTLVTVLIVAVFISLIGRSLSWYTHFYVSVFLYGTAAVAKLILVHTLAKKFYYKVSLTSLPVLRGGECSV